MAERAKRRAAAAKVSVSVAVAAVLAGVVGRDKGPEPVEYTLAGAQPRTESARTPLAKFLKRNVKVTTANIRDRSLLYRDFRPGQVYPRRAINRRFLKWSVANRTFLKIHKADSLFLKLTDAADTYLNKADASDVYLNKSDAGDTYLNKSDAGDTYLKIGDANNRFVEGDGTVLTGIAASSQGLVDLLELPGIAKVQGNNANSVRITNTSDTLLMYQTGGSSGSIAPGAYSDLSLTSVPSLTVQLLLPAVQEVATVTVSAFSNQTGANFVAQGLMGTP